MSRIETGIKLENDKKIKAKECKFVLHFSEKEVGVDLHIIKELIHYEDGSTKTNLRQAYDYKRPYYVTKPYYRNHKDKKEFELIKNTDIRYSTQSQIANSIGRDIGYVGYRNNFMRDVDHNPYIYGTDVKSTTLIKKNYMDRYPDVISDFDVCVLDIEADIDTDEITLITIAMRDKVYTAVLGKILNGRNKEEFIQSGIDNFYSDIPDNKIKKGKNIKVEIEVFDNESDLIVNTFKNIHKWQPDILAIWNMAYDISVIVARCEVFGIYPKTIFSDPNIPRRHQYFKFRMGVSVKKMESGKTMPKGPHEQWHTVKTPACYQVIDAMCVFHQIRMGSGNLPGGYGLDNVLKKILKVDGKLYKNLTDLKNAEWHKFMSKNEPLKYMTYNQYDVISMLELDYKTLDLHKTLNISSGPSDLAIFNSGPKQIVDSLYFYGLDRGLILATRDSKTPTNDILGRGNWIVTLQAHKVTKSGMQLLKESKNLKLNVRGHVYDSDAVSSYPSNTAAANISKDTTEKEIIKVEGIEKEKAKKQIMNLMFGPTNSLEFAVTFLGL